jgi:hypothetical protein
VFDELILTEISPLMKDLGEEVPVLAIIHNNICEILVFDDPVQGYDIGVHRGEFV